MLHVSSASFVPFVFRLRQPSIGTQRAHEELQEENRTVFMKHRSTKLFAPVIVALQRMNKSSNHAE